MLGRNGKKAVGCLERTYVNTPVYFMVPSIIFFGGSGTGPETVKPSDLARLARVEQAALSDAWFKLVAVMRMW